MSVPQLKRKNGSTFQKAVTANKKRRGSCGASVPDDFRLSGLGDHWPKFVSQRSRCEMCSLKQVESRPHSICSKCGVTLCVNERKNYYAEYHEYHL